MTDVSPYVEHGPWTDPTLLAQALRPCGGLVFLDSAMPHPRLGRYSYVAADPFAQLVVDDGIARWNGHPLRGEPMRALDMLLERYRQPVLAGLPPFQGGAVGYLAYELAGLLERLPAIPPPRGGPVPALAFAFYDVVWAFDHVERCCWLVSTGLPETSAAARGRRARARAAHLREAARRGGGAATAGSPGIARGAWRSSFTPRSYAEAVTRVREAILAGDIFQANIAQRFVAALPDGFCPWDFYRTLRRINPAPFAAYLERDGLTIASSSPERFMRVAGDQVETRPIKGTIRRADDPAEDRSRIAALASSVKDRAENVMIVDLMRNDLSRVCKPDSVRVPALCEIETYAGVHHLVSTVTGELAGGRRIADLLAASFPGGSISGAPKIKAMQIIAEIEKQQRGIYCGGIGYLGFNGNSDLAIAIRTAVFQNALASFHAGGGVTALSDPHEEHAETLAKADRIFAAFAAASDPA